MTAPGAKETILESIQEAARSWGGIQDYAHYLELPLLRQPEELPVSCRETPAAFEAVIPSFSATIHALFDAFHDFERLSNTDDGDEFIRKGGLDLHLHVVNQSFDRSPGCVHRVFHSRRLSLREPTALPQLRRVTQLRMLPSRTSTADIPRQNMRPVSTRVPLELDCPRMWEHMPIAFTLRTLRHAAGSWAGPWWDARHEFGTTVQQLHQQFPPSLTKARLWFWTPDGFYVDDNQGFHLPGLVRPPRLVPSPSTCVP